MPELTPQFVLAVVGEALQDRGIRIELRSEILADIEDALYAQFDGDAS